MSKRTSTTGVPLARIDLTGRHFGHWIVLEQDLEESERIQRVVWKCECDCGCGTQKSIRSDALKQVTVGGCRNMANLQGKKCEKCGKIFYPQKYANTRKFCYDCIPEQIQTAGSFYRKIIKRWSLEYKGNKCECCGYNNCIEALEFHHVNPEEKDFSLSDCEKLDWNKIKEELDKCILVCSNCHREIHAEKRNMDGTEKRTQS